MKLGVVVVNRNDGYKDYDRGIIHFRSMLETFDEVNYIDWNSPERSYLWDIKKYLPKTGKLKHFIISPDIVEQLIPYSDASKCNETLSRNIAIRRSQADWIVSTSIDIIPPKREDLINAIKTLDKNTFYTIDRRDLPLSLIEKYSLDQWKELREKANSTIPERRSQWDTRWNVTPNDHYSVINSCGDFQLAHRDIWFNIKGFEENMIYSCFSDTNVQKKAVLAGYKLEALYSPPLYHIEHKPYSINEKGERIQSEKFHGQTAQTSNNDPWRFVEWFEKTENTENWGLGDVEIEFEII
jgi:hypothetical protein